MKKKDKMFTMRISGKDLGNAQKLVGKFSLAKFVRLFFKNLTPDQVKKIKSYPQL